jgi:hypothetical protein
MGTKTAIDPLGPGALADEEGGAGASGETRKLKRRRLRPEIVRLTEEHQRLALVILGVDPPDRTEAIAEWAFGKLESTDCVLPLSSGKIGLLLTEATPVDAQALAERLVAEARSLGEAGAILCYGVATFPDETSDIDELIMKADMALFHARTGTLEPEELAAEEVAAEELGAEELAVEDDAQVVDDDAQVVDHDAHANTRTERPAGEKR